MRRGREIQQRATAAWELGSRWWVVGGILAVGLAVVFLGLLLWGDVEVARSDGEPYVVRDLLKDGADIAVKLGAVIGGMLAIYRHWYHRYEPLVYFVSCGLVPRTLLTVLYDTNGQFQRFGERLGLRGPLEDRLLQRWHDLPIIVLHRAEMDTLGVSEGEKVDLRFDLPDGRCIWSIAFAFSFPAASGTDYDDWPIGLSLSLRRYFRIERPFQARLLGTRDDAAQELPHGWRRVIANAGGLARLHGTTHAGQALVWMASEDYSVRFRDPSTNEFHAEDDLQGPGRIFEYVGISLRVFARSALRYRAASI